ncbi:MAG: hypothetical protein N2Z65_05940, partial [Clostridiales bacterium]|nr:hypothetical protein [Clostridiales bacterium]
MFVSDCLSTNGIGHLTIGGIDTVELAKEYGEPEWMRGTGRRNSHLLAVAPTVSNSIVSGNVSA